MSGVDDKVVSIKFENAQFMAKATETLATIEKLKTSLNFSGTSTSLGDLGASTAIPGMQHLQGAVEGVSTKFLALATIGITALSNITNKAISTGTQLVKSLSITPIAQGFSEFELKMGSIQTIMSGSGASLETVNQKLADLNAYSDKTIYSFKDMTSNIGKFTNAGVGLDESVAAIQGIANVAALSGANAEEASRAMYNFSQAMSSGSVKLMDWKSIELANMGTKEFKQQLIDSAVAMGTLTKEGDHYVTSQGTAVTATKGFNESLSDAWLTSEALTTTLGRYSDATTDIGKRATAAATDVKTFSQMIDTMKESVGSGWAQTFELVFGNFEEGKKLWTGINNWFSDTVGKSAQARNDVIQAWKGLGGRDVLLQGLKDAFKGLGSILNPIKEAFRDIFPKKTALELAQLTETFANFAKHLTVSGETAAKIKSVFSGLFSIFKIGFAVIKGVAGVIASFIGSFASAGGGALSFAANLGDTITKFKEFLIEGGGLQAFFEKVTQVVLKVSDAIKGFGGFIAGIFSAFKGGDDPTPKFEKLGDRLSTLSGIAKTIGSAFEKMGDIIRKVGDKITEWVKNFAANVFKPGDFNKALDVLNVGLLGGIVLLLKKFLDGGLELDLGGGLIDTIKNTFGELTNTLKAMQTQIKSKALMNIAIAVGVLTAAVLVLSMIDSAKLTKALSAMAVGFGQLVGAMALLDKIGSDQKAAAKLATLAVGMGFLAGAVLILSLAVKALSTMSWEELAKGLTGVTVLILGLAGASKLLEGSTKGLIRAGIGMVGMAIALLILAAAVKAFSTMSWSEMGKGMVGVAIGLGLLVLATKNMPKGMVAQGVGLIAIAVGLRILANAVQAFATMSWSEMGKGMAGVGAGLLIIALTMRLMPNNMLLTASGILVLSVALNFMAKAVETLGSMKLGALAKGIGAVAAVLLILSVATNSMTTALPGAIAMGVVAGALYILSGVIKELAKMSLKELAIGIGAIAATLAVLGIAAALMAPVIPALMGLGIALGLIGGAFALFGLGASLVAKAFETIARAGKAGIKAIKAVFEELIKALPDLIGALAEGLIQMGQVFLDAAPMFVRAVAEILKEVISALTDVLPSFLVLVGELISGLLELIREKVPEFITVGWEVLLAFLQGIRDNIGETTQLVIDILTNFAKTLTENMPIIIQSAVDLITSFLTELGNHAAELATAGLTMLTQFLTGIAQNLSSVVTSVANIIIAFLKQLAIELPRIVTAGTDLLIALLRGITDNLIKIASAVTDIVAKFIAEMGNNAGKIAQAGADALVDFLDGLVRDIAKVTTKAGEVVTKFIEGVGAQALKIAAAGIQALTDFLTGIESDISKAVTKGVAVVLKFIEGLGKNALALADGAAKVILDFVNGLTAAINKYSPELREAGRNLGYAIVDGASGGLLSKAGQLAQDAKSVFSGALGGVKSILGINSPSKVFYELGQNMIAGTANAFKFDKEGQRSVVAWGGSINKALSTTWGSTNGSLEWFDDIQPVITPVVDLSNVTAAGKGISGMLSGAKLSPSWGGIKPQTSWSQANEIAHTRDIVNDHEIGPGELGSKTVNYVQNNYSPEALSTSDIYRNTKSQIASVKEELKI